jgi:transglutaminase-like putative cysteine protease
MYLGLRPAQVLGDIAPTETPRAAERIPAFAIAQLPAGRDGAIATLKHMRDFVHDAVKDPDQVIRNQALSLVGSLPARKWFAEIEALHAFVKDRVRYVRDPDGYELVQTPEKTLENRQGDCDDKSTLLAALLKSIGHPARFIAVGLDGGDLSHVLVQTKVDSTGVDKNDWMSLETIIDRPPGWFPSGVTSRYILKV